MEYELEEVERDYIEFRKEMGEEIQIEWKSKLKWNIVIPIMKLTTIILILKIYFLFFWLKEYPY